MIANYFVNYSHKIIDQRYFAEVFFKLKLTHSGHFWSLPSFQTCRWPRDAVVLGFLTSGTFSFLCLVHGLYVLSHPHAQSHLLQYSYVTVTPYSYLSLSLLLLNLGLQCLPFRVLCLDHHIGSSFFYRIHVILLGTSSSSATLSIVVVNQFEWRNRWPTILAAMVLIRVLLPSTLILSNCHH